jgi:predicted RND superfamily exporter protein
MWIRRVLLIVAAVAFLAAGLSQISFNIDILKLLPTQLRQVGGLSLFLKHFALRDELIVTIEAPTAEAAEAAADSLAAHLRAHPDLVRRAVSRPPWEQSPGELTELFAYMILNQPPEKIRALVDRLRPEQRQTILDATLEKLNTSVAPQELAMLSIDPFGVSEAMGGAGFLANEAQSEFSSADGTFRVIYVESATSLTNYKQGSAWLKRIQTMAREWNTSGVALGFTGEPAFVAEVSSSMEFDMASSGFVTLFIVAAIFWLCYGRGRPLLYLVAMLVIIFVVSLAAAGIFLDQLTVMSVGFASIMIGLSVDYGYFIYQRALDHRGSLAELRRDCFANIIWTAGTTAAAFFALNVSSMPGLAQLGSLVGIGVIVGAFVMLMMFTPIALRLRPAGERRPSIAERALSSPRFMRVGAIAALVLVLALLSVLAVKGLPGADFTSRTLRPRNSQAYAAMDRLQARLIDEREVLNLIVTGNDEEEVRARLVAAEAQLEAAKAGGKVESFRSVLPLWAAPANQKANLPLLAPLAAQSAELKRALLEAGFTEDAFGFTAEVLEHWARWAAQPLPIWPANATSAWIFRRTVRHDPGHFIALGIVRATPGKEAEVSRDLSRPGIDLVSWKLLGNELQEVIPREFHRTFLGLVAIVLVLLLVGFRGFRDVFLLVVTMALVFACLGGAMTWLGMQWNFFNLAAILLLLGTGVDYSILFILALRRNGGDLADAQRHIGLVVALCGAAAAAGFGSIAWASNMGLASLGKTCALGLVLDAVISIFLLPVVWKMFHPATMSDGSD